MSINLATAVGLLFVVLNSHCHPPADPNLGIEKYSYPLVLYKNGNIIGGSTGFFYKTGNHSFFVTARHCLSGYDHFAQRYLSNISADYAVCMVRTASGNPYPAKIDLSLYRNIRHENDFKDSNDIEIIRFDFPDSVIINGIQDFEIDTNYLDKQIDSVATNGYIIHGGITWEQVAMIQPKRYSGRYSGRNAIFNNAQDSMYLNMMPAIDKGFSGAPIFFYEKQGKGTSITLGGLVIGANKAYNHTLILKPENIKRLCEIGVKALKHQ